MPAGVGLLCVCPAPPLSLAPAHRVSRTDARTMVAGVGHLCVSVCPPPSLTHARTLPAGRRRTPPETIKSASRRCFKTVEFTQPSADFSAPFTPVRAACAHASEICASSGQAWRGALRVLATEANGFRGRDILAPGAAEEFFGNMAVSALALNCAREWLDPKLCPCVPSSWPACTQRLLARIHLLCT